MPLNYKYIFFDLDRTLWDFDKNMHETMQDLYNQYLSGKIQADVGDFISRFNKVHELLWEQYRNGHLTKEKLRENRFYLTIQRLGLKDYELSKKLNRDYLRICPLKTHLVPGTIEVLEYLKDKYLLYILTNGFIETQQRKMTGCGLSKYFQKIMSSEEVGYNKPNPKIFAYAVSSVNAKKKECLMVGDDYEVDIKGAMNFGIDQVYVNFFGKNYPARATFEISALNELKTIL